MFEGFMQKILFCKDYQIYIFQFTMNLDYYFSFVCISERLELLVCISSVTTKVGTSKSISQNQPNRTSTH